MMNFYLYCNSVLDGHEEYGIPLMNVRKGYEVRYPSVEHIIKRDPSWSLFYAKNAVGGRWLEGEKSIMKDPLYSYLYARDIIKGRWKEAELVLMKEPLEAYYYARNVLKVRWLEAEPYIMEDWHWWNEYKKDFKI